MKKIIKTAAAFMSLAAFLSVLSCEEVPEQTEKTRYIYSDYESTTIPSVIPFNGGDYSIKMTSRVETKSVGPSFVRWQYRILTDGVEGDPVTVDEWSEDITVSIVPNYTEKTRQIAVEVSYVEENPQWEEIVAAEQEAGLVLMADFYWAKGNLTLKDGRFAIAEKMSETGLFFRNGSRYGVPAEDTYAGVAYTPDPETVALADIPYGDDTVDPCSLMDPGLRLPTHMELKYLFYEEDYNSSHTMDGVSGMGYYGSDFFMPYGGILSVSGGTLDYKSQYGAYWGSGEDYASNNLIYVMNDSYSGVDHDSQHTSLANVRCIRNIGQPSYVSHSPSAPESSSEFDLTVSFDPGEFPVVEIAAEGSDGAFVSKDVVTSQSQEGVLDIPGNESKEAVEWKIFVNRKFTGKTFIQPAMSDYAMYVSHSPAKATYEAFELTVTCDSDLASFPVEVKGDDGLVLSEVASKDRLSVTFDVPENTGDERKLSIYINGTDTGKSVSQEGKPGKDLLSVIWSEGYLTVKDGEYAFAAPTEIGLFFKWKSRYGIRLEEPLSASRKYQGVVYGPEEKQIPAYDDVTYGDTDPCSLVLPAGTWRLPSTENFEELGISSVTVTSDSETGCKTLSDGDQTIVLAPSAMLAVTGASLQMAYSGIYIWTGNLKDGGKADYYLWAVKSGSLIGRIGSIDSKRGMMVRCVRDK